MANRHNRKPRHIETEDVKTGDPPDSQKIAIPATRIQNYLRNWKQQGQIFTYSGNPDFTVNPGFADVKNNSNNDADCVYYVILHGPPKIDEATDPKRYLGGVLVPWRYRTTYTQNNRGTVSSTPTVKWTAPAYETFSDVVLDGDMEAATTASWTAVNATLAKDTSVFWEGTQSLKVSSTSTSDAGARQTIITGGKKYVVKGRARVDSGSGNFPLVNVGGTTWSGTTSTDWQYFRFEVASAASLTATFYCWNNTIGGVESVHFDDVEVLEATTVTPTAVTLYQKNGESSDYGGYLKYTDTLTDGDMELNNVTYWGAAANNTRAKTTSSPQEGTRALRITANAGQATGAVMYTYQNAILSGTTTLTPNRRYLLTGYARSDGTEIPMVYATTSAFGILQVLWTGTSSTSWQFFQVVFEADSTVGLSTLGLAFKVQSGPTAGTEYVDFDNIRLLEYDGVANNVYKGATQIFSDWDMELSGVTSFTDNFCTSSKDTSIFYRGTQSLKLAATAGANGNFYTLFSPGLTLTNEYRITGYARSDGESIPFISQDGANSILWIGTNKSTAWQYFDIPFTAVQTYIALRGGYQHFGNTTQSTGKEKVWFDNVEVWEVDHDYSGWKLHDKSMKRIILGNGSSYDDFYYVPPSDGGFCVGQLTTNNIQTCSLGVWSIPDNDLTLTQKGISEIDLLPKTSILGYGPSSKLPDIGSIYDLIGFAGNDYDDSVECMTRRCLFQWGHPVGYYATGSLSSTVFIGGTSIKVTPKNLKGLTGTDTVNLDMAFVLTTTGAASGSSIDITFTSSSTTRVFTYTADVTNSLETTSDCTAGTPLPVYAVGDEISVSIDFNGAGTQEVIIKTLSLWETSEF
jgi:hypothetical protein